MKATHVLSLLLCMMLISHEATSQLVRSPREWNYALKGNIRTATTVLRLERDGRYVIMDSTISYYSQAPHRPDSTIVYFAGSVSARDYYRYKDGKLYIRRSYTSAGMPLTDTFTWLSPTKCRKVSAIYSQYQADTLMFDELGRISRETLTTNMTGYHSVTTTVSQYMGAQVTEIHRESTSPGEETTYTTNVINYDKAGNPRTAQIQSVETNKNAPNQIVKTEKGLFVYYYTYY